tara:strand:- start:1574 stop:2038 length:465 start_codon:yes stop_codon:yes gene_type:complete
MSINDATPSEWDRVARSNIPQDMTTLANCSHPDCLPSSVGLEAWAEPAKEESKEEEAKEKDRQRVKNLWSRWCVTNDDSTVVQATPDPVNNPSHYNTGGVEAIQAIEASMSTEAFQGYLKGNCMKYIWRMSYKGKAKEDTLKAQWYLNRLIETL